MTVADRPAPPPDPTGAPRRYRIVRNPAAGAKGGISTNACTPEQLCELVTRHGLGDDIVEPGDEEAAREVVRTAARDGIDVVVAAGGDGTADLVAEELIDRDTALGILPLGSVMNVARALGIPRDLEAAARIARDGEVRRVDVGEADAADGRTLRFFEAGSVGMNAALFREAARFDEGDWASILRTIWVALRYRPARMRLELDDEVVKTRALMVTASIGPYTGMGMTVAPDAKVDDGRFDVRVFRGFSKWELIRHLFAIALGRRQYSPHVSTYQSSTVRVTSRHPLPARADGNDLGTTPVRFRTRTRALAVVVPRRAPDPADAPGPADTAPRPGPAAGQPAAGGSSGATSGRRRM